MKRVSITLGIIGGVLAILIGLIGIRSVYFPNPETYIDKNSIEHIPMDEKEEMAISKILAPVFIVLFSAGILAIVGAVKINSNIKTAETLLIISSIVTLVSFIGIAAFAFLLISFILTAIQKNKMKEQTSL